MRTGKAFNVAVGDACATASRGGNCWTIGTAAVEMTFRSRRGQFRLTSFRNKAVKPAQEYIAPAAAAAPFHMGEPVMEGMQAFKIAAVWEKYLPNVLSATGSPATADPADDKVTLEIKNGEMIGFAVGAHGGYNVEPVQWPVTVEYKDGARYASKDDTKLDQGPVWFYYMRKAGTGFMWAMDSTMPRHALAEEKIRISSPTASCLLSVPNAWSEGPLVGATVLYHSSDYDAVRVWQAPRDGTVTVRGQAAYVGRNGDADLRILRINRIAKPATTKPKTGENAWAVDSAKAVKVVAGGRPAVRLDFVLKRASLRAHFHVLAFPGTAIMRQWLEFANAGKRPVTLRAAFPSMSLQGRGASPLNSYWFEGSPAPTMMHNAAVTPTFHHRLEGRGTNHVVPWMAFQQGAAPADGWFIALEYLGGWGIAADRDASGPLTVAVDIPELAGRLLAPGERLALPKVTLGVFGRDLDDLMERVYDWQYEYLWDYTSDEWYGRMPYCGSNYYTGAFNSQENFAGRLGWLDMGAADLMRSNGMELLWNDAGWSESADCWCASQEGPDFAQTLRYLDKMGMKMALWFAGRPRPGLMDGKVGAWGDIQWRTDCVGDFGFASDASWREQVTGFRSKNPGSSFHTCNFGSAYAHTFDMQSYAETNYLSDGYPDPTNYYLSYMETPDRWVDICTVMKICMSVRNTGKYDAYSYAEIFTMVPAWATPGPSIERCDPEYTRVIAGLYRYLRRAGVAGRWSYMFHPAVKGDAARYYAQRTSHDRKQALIIPMHRAPDGTVIYPRGLLPGEIYTVGFYARRKITARTGADLMQNGIVLAGQPPRELIFLGLPKRPGSGTDKQPPKPPGRVLARCELNIGHTGIGVYWSPGSDDNWVSHYEVRRGKRVLGKVAIGTYYFDHTPLWDAGATYSVRTVDGDGNRSPWAEARKFSDEAPAYSALGGHSAEKVYNGWSAETTADGRAFADMVFVRPAKEPFVDFGLKGTVNQVGGLEGYWEGAGSAQAGRGWQRASAQACCVRTWTAPRAGTVRIVGRAMKEYHSNAEGEALRVRILHNRKQAWPKAGWATLPLGDLFGQAHDFTLDLAEGDTIRFVLDKATAPARNIAVWMPRIVYAAAPGKVRPAQPVRILCGAKSPYTDKLGNVWSADRFFSGGSAVFATPAIADAQPTPDDLALYQAGREGKCFTYAIPLPPGLYAVRLKFAETKYEYFFERPFNLSINGREVLHNFDICQAARGPRRAHERVFRFLVPDAGGRLELHFTGAFEPTQLSGQAMVQAIEVVPELKPSVRINCGASEDFVDWNACVWSKDSGFEGGRGIAAPGFITQASPTLYDQKLYQSARAGKSFSYSFDLPPGLYTVHLKFAELWNGQPGRRPMNIDVNGRRVRANWDPAAAAGLLQRAADFRVKDVTPDRNGKITIRAASADGSDAILQGIEIE